MPQNLCTTPSLRTTEVDYRWTHFDMTSCGHKSTSEVHSLTNHMRDVFGSSPLKLLTDRASLFCSFSSRLSCSHLTPSLFLFCITYRSSPATVTTTCTKRTCSNPPSSHDSSASCRGRGTDALPCEWSCWAVMSKAPPTISPSLPLLLYFPPFLPELSLHCLTLINRGRQHHTSLRSWVTDLTLAQA